MNGYDISSVQNNLNPAIVPGDFIGIKISEGSGYINPTWEIQAKQAIAAKKRLILYHFITNDPIQEQVNIFTNTARNYLNQAILALDFETGTIGNEIRALAQEHRNSAEVWLNTVKTKTKGTPIIYMNAATTRAFDWSSVANKYGLWLAQYGSENSTGYQTNPWTDGKGFGAWKSPTIHQYSSNGRLSGYDGALDLNLAYLTDEQWDNMAGISVANPATVTTNTVSTTNTTLEDDELMKFTYEIIDAKTNKTQGTIYFYDGTKVVALTNVDQFNIIKTIYKDTVGKDLKHYQWRTDAPWYVRFLQAINQKAPEVAWK